MSDDPRERLKARLEQQQRRLGRAERERETLLAQTIYLGTLGILFVVPVLAGGYLGNWLDGMAEGFSSRWTASLLFLGVVVGALNVYFFIRERQ